MKTAYLFDTNAVYDLTNSNYNKNDIQDFIAYLKANNTTIFITPLTIIELLLAGAMPAKIMINTHPQRWGDQILPWVVELVGQNLKNEIKRRIRRD